MKESRLTGKVLQLATKMRGENVGWSEIARYLHVNVHHLRYRLEPTYNAEIRVKQLDDYHAAKNANALPYAMPKPPLLYKDPLLDKLRAGAR
jgi:hypothetical protein